MALTRTDSETGRPGWGIGAAGVVFGVAGNLSYGGILSHHSGEKNFSLTLLQPIICGLAGAGTGALRMEHCTVARRIQGARKLRMADGTPDVSKVADFDRTGAQAIET